MSATSTQKRVAALEAAGIGEIGPVLLLVSGVQPGTAGDEIKFADMLGQRIVRQEAESEAQFLTRLEHHARAARRELGQGVVLAVGGADFRQIYEEKPPRFISLPAIQPH
jgi:hypothetical protein